MIYKGYHIQYDPKPIPTRNFDYDFWHEDYDGPEDRRNGNAGSVRDCMIEIDDRIEDER